MAASGLTEESALANFGHVAAIADFAFAMKKQLDYVNENSWNNFKLRIGKNLWLFKNILKW